ncbi:MAG: sterol desaturase family protein [Chitinophagales bacterium]
MEHNYPDIILYAIPFFVILMAIEFYINYKERKELFDLKDSISSITMGIGSIFVDLFTKVIYLTFFIFLYEFRVFDLGTTWWVWLILIFLEDFFFYWKHRFSHQVRFLWASHSVHHSSQRYNLSTALRQEWIGRYFAILFYIALPLLGFHPLMILLVRSASLIYQYWIHTETINKFPNWFEFFMNTPSHHRVHHATNDIYLDKNHAGVFIIWDRMFGTFQEELKTEKPIYGLTENINSYKIFDIASFEWLRLWKDFSQKNISLKARFLYLLMPPGWKHDGTGITTKTLQQNLKKN